MPKGQFDMLHLCAGGVGEGGLWYFPLINQHLLRGGSEKKPWDYQGGFKKMKGKKKEIIIAHPLDKLWMLPKFSHLCGAELYLNLAILRILRRCFQWCWHGFSLTGPCQKLKKPWKGLLAGKWKGVSQIQKYIPCQSYKSHGKRKKHGKGHHQKGITRNANTQKCITL